MKLHILSDLHLEFATFEPPTTDADLIVLAGDIGSGDKGVQWARKAFPEKPIVYVPGNHEFYGSQRIETLSSLHATGKQNNVNILDSTEFVLGGVRFLGGTLWTDFQLFGEEKKLEAIKDSQFYIQDFSAINEEGNTRFTPARSIELHEQFLAWLIAKLDEPFAGKTVVITHHLPSPQSVVAQFKTDIVSACFASELDHLFGKMNLWIHGHTHESLDYEVNGTRVICNPRGYVLYSGNENFDFNPSLLIEV